MKKITIIICFALVMFTSVDLLSAAMDSSNYQIWSDAISVGGGEDQSSDNYNLQDTLGEFGVGTSSSTNYGIRAGFRQMDFFEGDQVLSLSIGTGSLELGELSTGSAAATSTTMVMDTNSITGLSVTYTGSTLTCGACGGTNTVTAIGATSAASSVGSSQFGFNVVYSSGTSPVASSTANYGTAGNYAFNSTDEVVTSSGQINETTFDLNYIANISGSETSGTYTTSVIYTATANF